MTEQSQSEQQHFNDQLDAIIMQEDVRMQALQGNDDLLRVAARINAGAHPSISEEESDNMRRRVYQVATTLPKVAEASATRQRTARSGGILSRLFQIVILILLIAGGLFFLRPFIEDRLGIQIPLPSILPETTPEATEPAGIATATPTPTLSPTSTPETSLSTQAPTDAVTATPTLASTNSPTPTITVEPTTEFLTVQANGNVRVRAGAGTEFDVVGVVEPGTSVAVITNQAGAEWIQVRLEDGTEGWIASFLLTDTP
ncbi:MAG: SH3 domain-containing protein [Chloroflexota bacterium]